MNQRDGEQLNLLASSAHDLKSPLIFIRGAAAQAQNPKLNQAQKDQLMRRVELSSDRLLKLIDSLIGTAQSQAPLPLEPVHVSDIINQAHLDISDYANELGFEFHIRYSKRLPPVLTNRLGLRRILFNLMDNAVKYSQAKPQARIQAKRDGNDYIRLTVRDYGVGLRPSDLKAIQKLHTQAEQPSSALPGSSGLGLILSNQIAQSLSAKLTFQPLTNGTSFNLRLPVARQLNLFV